MLQIGSMCLPLPIPGRQYLVTFREGAIKMRTIASQQFNVLITAAAFLFVGAVVFGLL
jgi:hypothetical protein